MHGSCPVHVPPAPQPVPRPAERDLPGRQPEPRRAEAQPLQAAFSKPLPLGY